MRCEIKWPHLLYCWTREWEGRSTCCITTRRAVAVVEVSYYMMHKSERSLRKYFSRKSTQIWILRDEFCSVNVDGRNQSFIMLQKGEIQYVPYLYCLSAALDNTLYCDERREESEKSWAKFEPILLRKRGIPPCQPALCGAHHEGSGETILHSNTHQRAEFASEAE